MLRTQALGVVGGALGVGLGGDLEGGVMGYALVLLAVVFVRLRGIEARLTGIRATLIRLARKLPVVVLLAALGALPACRTDYRTQKTLTIHAHALTVSWPVGERSNEPEPGGVWIYIDQTDHAAARAQVESQAEAAITPKVLP